jgi:hypothetical protein
VEADQSVSQVGTGMASRYVGRQAYLSDDERRREYLSPVIIELM